jgi:hypothetical protein
MSDVKGFSEQIELEELQQAEPLHPATPQRCVQQLLSNESWSERRTSYLQCNHRERGAHYLAHTAQFSAIQRKGAQKGAIRRNSAQIAQIAQNAQIAQKGATRRNSAQLGATRRTIAYFKTKVAHGQRLGIQR